MFLQFAQAKPLPDLYGAWFDARVNDTMDRWLLQAINEDMGTERS